MGIMLWNYIFLALQVMYCYRYRLFLISLFINMCIRKWGRYIEQISKVACFFHFYLLFFLISSILSFAANSNHIRFSRIEGKSRRSYALNMDEGRGKSGVWKLFPIFIQKNSLSQLKSACVSKIFLIHAPTNFLRENSYVLNNMRNKAKRSSMIALLFYRDRSLIWEYLCIAFLFAIFVNNKLIKILKSIYKE